MKTNIRFIAYAIIIIVLGVFILKTPQIYFVWAYIAFAFCPFFLGMGIAPYLATPKLRKIIVISGIGISIISISAILITYYNDLAYILK